MRFLYKKKYILYVSVLFFLAVFTLGHYSQLKAYENKSGKNNTPQTGLKVIQNALNYLGTAYIYGGASKKIGMDCSGFVMTAFRTVGINMPRTSHSQIKVGKHVEVEKIRKGDLIFFYGRGFNKDIIEHVGIYIGGGDFIHSSRGEGGVVIDSLKENRYYGERIAEIRRIIDE